MNALIAYFSCSGVTEKVAQTIAQVTKGKLYEIKPAVPYTSADLDWNNPNSRSSIEMKDKFSRPQIAHKIENIEQYDVIFVGFPIWWYVAPTIINTFLESYDFDSQIIVPFATSGGSGVGQTDQYLQSSCSQSVHWCPTTMLNGNPSQTKIAQWIESLDL